MVSISTSWHSYPKIYHVGHAAIDDIFKEDVIVEEKIDGSQFSWCLNDTDLMLRSRSRQFGLGEQDKMFNDAVESVANIQGKLTKGWTYRAEYLGKPKHNALAYDRIPFGHLMIFDVNTGHEKYLDYDDKKAEAERLGLECVPCLYRGRIESADQLIEFLKMKSVLGGPMIEGMVIKNYKAFTSHGQAMIGKYVSEQFKEVHKRTWTNDNPSKKDVVDLLCATYRHENRWYKALQYLKEAGELQGAPQDIPILIKRIQKDIGEECADEIKEVLYNWAVPRILRASIRGMPEWYKSQLMKGAFDDAMAVHGEMERDATAASVDSQQPDSQP